MRFWEGYLASKSQSAEKSPDGGNRVVKLPALGSVAVSVTVNCIGERCPRPHLLAKKALRNLENGQVIEVIVDNSSSVETIPVMLPSAHGKHLTTIRSGNSWALYVMKVEKPEYSKSQYPGDKRIS